MNKGAKINAFLIGLGMSAEVAYKEAQRLEKCFGKTKAPTSAPKVRDRVHGGGTSLKSDIISYGRTRKGNVFTLAQIALGCDTSPNNVSAQLTHLIREGVLVRTGRGEYRMN